MRTLRGLWPRLPLVALSLSLSVGLTLWGGATGGPAGAGGGGGGGPGSTRTSHAAYSHSHSHSHVSSHASSHTSPPRRTTRAPNDDAALFCTDTCAAGLGAPRCGDAASCRPARLRNASAAHLADAMAVAEREPKHGQPREELCPQLCPLLLGEPLCSCGGTTLAAARAAASTTWRQEACDVLCAATGRVPRGCDPCQPTVAYTAAETIDWEWWCHVLCLEGDGGIACLCDLNP